MSLLMKPTITATSITVQLSLLIISSIISLSKCDQTTTKTTSNITTINLHHSDLSPPSPHYNPSLSHYQRVANALRRLSYHHRNLQAAKQTPPIIVNNGRVYFLDYSIGINPSVALQGILGTGSDLIWTPCTNAITRSKSFTTIPCNNPRCKSLPGSFCDKKRRCSYKMTYGDGSSTTGYLFTDTITLGSAQFPNIIFGCATRYIKSNGVVGLGGGAVSLVKQIGYGQFSYCLVSFDSKRSTSKLHLGENVAAGTPITLFRDSQTPTFYNVKLVGIKVGNNAPLPFGKNMILDSGTGTTNLPGSFYYPLLKTLRTSIGTNNVTDPNHTFDLCYSKAPGNKFPDITLKFESNVYVKWTQENVLARVGKNLWCFAAFPIDEDQEAIFGNLAQVNLWMGFDLNRNTVTMQPTDCGRSN